MSIAQIASDSNFTAQPLSSCFDTSASFYQCRIDINIAEMTPEAIKHVVCRALNVKDEGEAEVTRVIENSTGFSVEFSNVESRVKALQKMKEYAQLPNVCVATGVHEDTQTLTPVASAIDCVEWVRSGQKSCPIDGRCPFRHPPAMARVPCRHWVRNRGQCWYGHLCSFLHPASALHRSSDASKGGSTSDGNSDDCRKYGDASSHDTKSAEVKFEEITSIPPDHEFESADLSSSANGSGQSTPLANGQGCIQDNPVIARVDNDSKSAPVPQSPSHSQHQGQQGTAEQQHHQRSKNPWAAPITSAIPSAADFGKPSSPRDIRRSSRHHANASASPSTSAVVGSPWLARSLLGTHSLTPNADGYDSGNGTGNNDDDEDNSQSGSLPITLGSTLFGTSTISFEDNFVQPLSTSISSFENEMHLGRRYASAPPPQHQCQLHQGTHLSSSPSNGLDIADSSRRVSGSSEHFPLSTSFGSAEDEIVCGSDTSLGSTESMNSAGLSTPPKCVGCVHLRSELRDTTAKLKAITSLNAELARSMRTLGEENKRVGELERLLQEKDAEIATLKG